MAGSYNIEQWISSQTSLSRRKILEAIKAKRVQCNEKIVDSLKHPVRRGKDTVTLDGVPILWQHPYMYFMFNKPADVICTMSDPKGRRDLTHFLKSLPDVLFPIGRLDRQTTGLLLFTNDGEFAQKVSHPQFHIPKTYRVTLDKPLTKARHHRLLKGIFLEDGPVRFMTINPQRPKVIDVTLAEGRYRIIRRTFDFLGYTIEKLKRLQIGSLKLGKLKEGEFLKLSKNDIRSL